VYEPTGVCRLAAIYRIPFHFFFCLHAPTKEEEKRREEEALLKAQAQHEKAAGVA
jgi:hypothetical protein